MKKILPYLIFIFSVIVGSCSNDDQPTVVPKGNRNLGIHVTEGESLDFDKSFQIAKGAGMDCIPQVFYWRDLEDASGYDPFNFLPVMNTYYPLNAMKVSLCISPIAAADRNMPDD